MRTLQVVTNRLLTSLRILAVPALALLMTVLLMLMSSGSTTNASSDSTSGVSRSLVGTEQAAVIPPHLRPRAKRAMQVHRCSSDPTASTDRQESALVIVRGSVRHVDLDRAWDVYTGTRPGRFVALCEAPRPSR